MEADKARARAKMLGMGNPPPPKVKVEKDCGKDGGAGSAGRTDAAGAASPARDITNEQKSCSPAERTSTSSVCGEKENVKPDPGSDDVKPEVTVRTEVGDEKPEVLRIAASSEPPSSSDASLSCSRSSNKEQTVVEIKPSSAPSSPLPREGAEDDVERSDSPILDVTTVDDEETTLEGGTPVTCVA